MKQRIAIATCAELPSLFGGEKLLIPELERLGHHVSVEIWDDPEVEWAHFDVVLIRCTWDYHEKLDAFMSWLEHLKQSTCLVLNSLESLMWNLDKRYLFELQSKDVNIIPGFCLEAADQRSLTELMDAINADEVVVKPVQSAGAWRTLRIRKNQLHEQASAFEQWRHEQAFMVQKFMPEIVAEGEWSLVFFNGEYSHSLLKRAKPGDFRVQSDHGGRVEAAFATQEMRQQACRVLEALPTTPCYARVDGVWRDGQFYLMELELLEPELFLEIDAQAPRRFSVAIQSAIDQAQVE
ncbi:hypothetical protein RF679_03835 [Undibacterium cyanobacteriorum]|uniref:Prokaryotic glutathione synthetase ATP-binding domain-containing protein n=1 Tax=Undibacterium cyanobacteriorum TaxID=3073561 RepID=A0ABY9RKP6_9BURK|nr:hypothetical protein [Undibacterium sp. 20NA77.5]WMW81418.1 hypothetical protein RF679_03835 [Undibacterium sp. 20NA77.5]